MAEVSRRWERGRGGYETKDGGGSVGHCICTKQVSQELEREPKAREDGLGLLIISHHLREVRIVGFFAWIWRSGTDYRKGVAFWILLSFFSLVFYSFLFSSRIGNSLGGIRSRGLCRIRQIVGGNSRTRLVLKVDRGGFFFWFYLERVDRYGGGGCVV